MQRTNRTGAPRSGLAAKTALFCSLLISGLSLNASAQTTDPQGSLKTVDALLAIDNERALRKAEARTFGSPSSQAEPVEQPSQPAVDANIGMSISQLVSAQEVRLVAVYGQPGALRADIKSGLEVYEGARIGDAVHGCEIASISATTVTFKSASGGRCAPLKWDGEPSSMGR